MEVSGLSDCERLLHRQVKWPFANLTMSHFSENETVASDIDPGNFHAFPTYG